MRQKKLKNKEQYIHIFFLLIFRVFQTHILSLLLIGSLKVPTTSHYYLTLSLGSRVWVFFYEHLWGKFTTLLCHFPNTTSSIISSSATKVLYFCVGFWELSHLTRDLSLAENTMRTNLPKTLDLLIISLYSLNFSIGWTLQRIKLAKNYLTQILG